MTEHSGSGWKHVGPEPWRVEPLRDYDGPPPIPLDALKRELEAEDGWRVEHGVYVGQFDGVTRWIPITIASHPAHGTYQWFPIAPDGRA